MYLKFIKKEDNTERVEVFPSSFVYRYKFIPCSTILRHQNATVPIRDLLLCPYREFSLRPVYHLQIILLIKIKYFI